MPSNRELRVCCLLGICCVLVAPRFALAEDLPAAELPAVGSVVVDTVRREVILSAQIQFPEGKPCINEFGQRVQAFAGCATAAGGEAKMAGYFVFFVTCFYCCHCPPFPLF